MWLVIEDDGAGGCAGVAVPLREGNFVIGRDASCDLVLPCDTVSRRHVQIKREGEAVSFRDLGSPRGTSHNGVVSTGGGLAPGDALAIGDAVLRLASSVPRDGRPRRRAPAGLDWRPFRSFLDRLRRAGEPRALLELLLQGILEFFDAERGFVLMADAPGTKLVPVALSPGADPDLVAVSSTVYGKAMAEGSVVVVHDTMRDDLCKGAPSLSPQASSRTIFCAPLMARGETWGAIYVDRPMTRALVDSDQLQLLETVSGLAAELVAAARTRRHLLAAKGAIEALKALDRDEERIVLGDGPATAELRSLLESAAPKDVTVLITGETGTGKEMVARALHRASDRENGPFVAVHCAALAADVVEAELFGAEKGAYTGATQRRLGRFELAEGGTLFLDEVGEVSPELQVKLLRALQERRICRVGGTDEHPVDFRLVCATNTDLERAVRVGTFRQDLYYRVNVFRIHLRPLRERPEDVPVLARHFLATFASRFGKNVRGFTPEADALIRSYSWPGNIRELRNAVERAVVVEAQPLVRAESLPIGRAPVFAADADPEACLRGSLPRRFAEAEELFLRVFLRRSIDENGGNVTAAAKAVGLTRNAMYRRLYRVGLVSSPHEK